MIVRRVRTLAGVEKYGQPIGSIITRDASYLDDWTPTRYKNGNTTTRIKHTPKIQKDLIKEAREQSGGKDNAVIRLFNHLHSGATHYSVLRDKDGKIRGAAQYDLNGYVSELFLDDEAKGQGRGTQLMSEVARHLLELGHEEMRVSGVVGTARGFYVKIGATMLERMSTARWDKEHLQALALLKPIVGEDISVAEETRRAEERFQRMYGNQKGGEMGIQMETKIRRVRTPEGVAKYGQPIGSVIVADATPSRRRLFGNSTSKVPLPAPDKAPKRVTRARTTKEKIDRRGVPKLNKTSSPYKGWLAWQRSDSEATYYVGPDPKREGSYVAVDKSGKVIARGPSQGEAKIALDQTIGTYKPDVERGDYGHLQEVEDKKALEAWRKKFGVKLPPGGQYEITTDESKDIIGRYIDVHGDVRNIRNPKVVEAGQVEKWKRVSALSKDLAAGKLGKELEKDALTSQTAAAVLLMRRTGMRAASSSDRQRGETFAYGATNLLNSHIKEGPNGVIVVELTTKKGQDYRKEISDPALVAAIKTWWDPSDPRGHVFPDTNSEKTIDYIRAKTGGEYGNHDLRRYMGSLIAATMVRRIGRARPKTMAEYKTMVKRISEEVAAQLGNTPDQALNYYIDPAIFSAWKDAL